ncbi:hypothetical protein, partial [Nocardia abscessus]|uniref:hypothetical protein n=1 Tax=Nocardia abscessus TaxID=120957 RepID=UPI002454E600
MVIQTTTTEAVFSSYSLPVYPRTTVETPKDRFAPKTRSGRWPSTSGVLTDVGGQVRDDTVGRIGPGVAVV